jgi:arsenate reductase-like glutaredoxin family protein
MAKVLKSYLDKITDLEEKIDREIDELLSIVDINQLLSTHEVYMQELSKQFFESLDDELKQAIEAGEVKADRIIKSIGSKIQKD